MGYLISGWVCTTAVLWEKSESENRSVMSDSLRPPWTIQSMAFYRPEYWRSIPSPGDLPNPGIKPGSPALQADSLLTEL